LLYYKEIQQEFEQKSEGMLAGHFIKSDEKFYAPKLFDSPQAYLNSEKTHFFEYINFTDPVIINSNVITQAVLDYVFYLNVSDDVEVQQKLYKNAIDRIFNKVAENNELKSEIVETLIYAFAQSENISIVDYLEENYYNTLPNDYKNNKDITSLLDGLKLAIGRKAPDFSWDENGETQNLYSLNTANNYVLVFWSSSCSHCTIEIPKLYEYMLNVENVQVIDVALENDQVEFEKYAQQFENWINVLGLEKWQNPIAKAYSIVSTPTYFILNKEKVIIEKPEHFEDVQAYFNK
jgi:thiol-disulfide isomerase/thioredoxin